MVTCMLCEFVVETVISSSSSIPIRLSNVSSVF